jgi:hypothetical protein
MNILLTGANNLRVTTLSQLPYSEPDNQYYSELVEQNYFPLLKGLLRVILITFKNLVFGLGLGWIFNCQFCVRFSR